MVASVGGRQAHARPTTSNQTRSPAAHMERPAPHKSPSTGRKPLGDATNRANLAATPVKKIKSSSAAALSPSSTGLPHHESLANNGSLTVRNVTDSPENKRLSSVTAEENVDSKRSSQVSTTSTNASSKGRKRKTHIGPWQLGPDIGKGGCGKVRIVRHAQTGQRAAAKIISKKVAEKARAESLANLVMSSKRPHAGVLAAAEHVMPFGIEREVVIMKLLEHPNVVKLYDVWENRNELYLIMEYVEGGELFEYVEQNEHLEEDETVWLFRQVLAALLHCHRLGIHHRDLKPENILLDRYSSKVKLVDFGMAALQPKGKLLTTPCGSIHYAAPEVFEKIYDGSKVDVWSLGVILYVMLTGSTPFQYDPSTMTNNVVLWYNVIKAGVFHMPPELSIEAQDLIKKMLIPNPKQRISLETIWKHPLLSKYCQEWNESEEDVKLDNWIGAKPVIEAWDVAGKHDIDREILRNLRTLWHSEREEILIERLLSREPNQEKFFYYALQKHREEQLENYAGPANGVSYSTSDYHHAKATNKFNLSDIPPVPKSAYSRTRSQFSILNDEEHTQSKQSLADRPLSTSSYDPYRASSGRLWEGKEQYTNVIIHRGASRNSKTNSAHINNKQQTSLRREALIKQQRLSTTPSAFSMKSVSPSLASRSVGVARTVSRSSMGSSLYPKSPQPARNLKPSEKHKRSVNFSHVRRSSTVSALNGSETSQSKLLSPKSRGASIRRQSTYSNLSPKTTVTPIIRSRKEGVAPDKQRAALPQSRIGSQVIDNEARKVSTELEKFCEEAFFRSSVASSNMTSRGTGSLETNDTPPSSISNKGSVTLNAAQGDAWTETKLQTPVTRRVLPTPPDETPNTFMTRELAETRRKLAARYAADESAHNTTYSDVLAHLDALLNPSDLTNVPPRSPEPRRITSAPETRSPEYSSPLPAISEETKGCEGDYLSSHRNYAGHAIRSSTDPFSRSRPPLRRAYDSDDAMNLLEQATPLKVEPLVIRKASSYTSHGGMSEDDGGLRTRFYKDSLRVSRPADSKESRPNPLLMKANLSQHSGEAGSVRANSLKPINEERKEDKKFAEKQATVEGTSETAKKKGWFWRKSKAIPKSSEASSAAGMHSVREGYRQLSNNQDPGEDAWSDVKDSQYGQHATGYYVHKDEPREGVETPETTGKRPGFLKFLGRRANAKAEPAHAFTASTAAEDEVERSNSNGALSFDSHGRARTISPIAGAVAPTDLGVKQSWLAKIFHIQPASRMLCFQTGRGVARQEMVRLLRRWRMHGVRDVSLDRERNLIFGRLAPNNILGLKEVAFVIELFVVLDKGKRAGLSMARWTQRFGAASSFRRIVSEVEAVLKGRGMIVTDRNMAREMESILSEP